MTSERLTNDEILEIEGYIERDVIKSGIAEATFNCVHFENTRCANYVECSKCALIKLTNQTTVHRNLNGITIVW